jgi:DNA primase
MSGNLNLSPSTLEKVVSEDFTVLNNGGRWAKTEEHDSLVLDLEEGIFYWNSRNIRGNALDWLMKVRQIPFLKAIEMLTEVDKASLIPQTISFSKPAPVVEEPLVDIFWTAGKNKRDYWYKRTLSDETIDYFKLGYNKDWFTLPIYENGTFKNFQLRRDNPKMIRYYYSGTEGPFLVNSDVLKTSDSIVMTEGAVDCLALFQRGVPAVSHTAGANFLAKWFPWFLRQNRIYYIADNDYAGVQGANKVAQILGTYKVKVLRFSDKSDKYDTIDFLREGGTIEELTNLLETKSKYVFER